MSDTGGSHALPLFIPGRGEQSSPIVLSVQPGSFYRELPLRLQHRSGFLFGGWTMFSNDPSSPAAVNRSRCRHLTQDGPITAKHSALETADWPREGHLTQAKPMSPFIRAFGLALSQGAQDPSED